MEGCWECLRVDLVKICTHFVVFFIWTKLWSSTISRLRCCHLMAMSLKKIRLGQSCEVGEVGKRINIFRFSGWHNGWQLVEVFVQLRASHWDKRRWESGKVGGTIAFHWFSARTVRQMQQLSRRLASKLGEWDKDGFRSRWWISSTIMDKILVCRSHKFTQYVLCGEFWDPEEGWPRRNPKCLTRKAQRFVFTASVSGIPKSHFSNESPEPRRMLGVGLGQSCPGILQS